MLSLSLKSQILHYFFFFLHLWAQTVKVLNTLLNPMFSLSVLHRAEIFHPSMRALAQHLGTERDYELLLSGSQSLLSPPGASEVDVKTWQVQYGYRLRYRLVCLHLLNTLSSLSAPQTAGELRVRHDQSDAEEDQQRADAGGVREDSTGLGPPDR